MSIDNVTDVTPRNQYTASAAQTVFPYAFPIFQDADLVVNVDGVDKTLTTHYTVSGEGDDLGGNVTFLSGQTAGAVVTIYRDTVIERTSDLQQNGPIASETLNDELDRLFIIVQELKAKISRAIRFPFTSSQGDAELNPISSWYSKFLYIGSTGLLEPAATVSGVVALTQDLIGSLLNPQTSVETSRGITAINRWYAPGNVLRYGTNTTPGTTNMSAAWQAAATLIDTYDMVAPAGIYQLTQQVVITAPGSGRAHVYGYGAQIKSAGLANYPIKITGIVAGGVTVHGIYVDHYNNTTSLGGFDIVGAWYTTLEDCFVLTSGTVVMPAGYAGVRVRSSNPASADATASLWTTISRLRMWTSGSPNLTPIGVKLQGPQNSTVISHCSFSAVTVPILHTYEPGNDNISNSVRIESNALEGYVTAVSVVGSGNSALAGLSYSNNRYESGTEMYKFSGISSVSQAPFSYANAIISNAGTYLTPSTFDFNSLDPSITPDGHINFYNDTPARFGARITDALEAQGPVGCGFALYRNDGVLVGTWRARAGSGSIVSGNGTSLYLAEIAQINFGATTAAGLYNGSGTPEAAVTAAVGSFYLDTTNGVAYMKKTGIGNTGWKLVTQAA